MKKLRCAIYTRKSTDEGLDQTFNSLDAQREACAAYILSQAGEGWAPLREIYDDGGYSGGSMERPALKRLMAEIEAGRIDVIVVYKVDRLTRSLADFARIVEILDRTGASFVSITQAFNTTTSMGRLTLNVLLSFAQFEREVTGERIRDKIAASKAKGMWMGGNPPLGYDVRDRALHANPSEAETVRDIFARYLEVRSVVDVRDELSGDGVRSKAWVSRAGRAIGGTAFTHGALYHILANRIYVGEIEHRGRVHVGQHEPIVARDLFDAVQLKLKAGAPALPQIQTKGRTSPFLGKLFDDRGNAMTSAHANKRGRRYFYYVSTAVHARKPVGGLARVSALKLEHFAIDRIAPLLDPGWLPDAALSARVTQAMLRIELSADKITFDLARDAITQSLRQDLTAVGEGVRFESVHDLAQRRPGRAVIASGGNTAPRVDRALVRAIVQARRWQEMLASGEPASIQDLAVREATCPIYTGQLLPLAFLAPDLVEAIIDGRQPPRLSLNGLIDAALPLRWRDQRALFSRFA